jgi:hypothetical protein
MGTVRVAALDFDGGAKGGLLLGRSLPQLTAVTSRVRNEPVLAALRKLTGEDHGYDVAAWRRWWDQTGRHIALEREAAWAESRPGATVDENSAKKQPGDSARGAEPSVVRPAAIPPKPGAKD